MQFRMVYFYFSEGVRKTVTIRDLVVNSLKHSKSLLKDSVCIYVGWKGPLVT